MLNLCFKYTYTYMCVPSVKVKFRRPFYFALATSQKFKNHLALNIHSLGKTHKGSSLPVKCRKEKCLNFS